MSVDCTRRDVLRAGAGLAGWFAGGGAVCTLARQPVPRKTVAAPSMPVAIQRCESYKPELVTARLRKALDLIGGIEPLVRGKTVAIKLNLTGGPQGKLAGLPAHRTYHVHPHFVAATCAVLHDAGARRIVLLESGYHRRPLEDVMADADWNVDAIDAAAGGKVVWEDTRNKGSWKGYSRLAVPWGGYVYPAFDLNRRYEQTDVFISLAKMKDHANAGITLCVKNLFGIAPTSIYGDSLDGAGSASTDERCISPRGNTFHRGTRHPPAGAPQELKPESPRHWSYRVARVTADLFGARPADLCLVDGIETNRGGEGPWVKGAAPLRPRLLFAGRNGVCTDSICAAAMGYDPAAGHKQFPFMGDNHLTLLADQGIGSNVVDDIEVLGLPLDQAVHPFNPERRKVGTPLFS